MKSHTRPFALLITLLAPAAAYADNWDGIGLALALPVLLASSFLYGALAIPRRLHGFVYAVGTLIFVPFVMFISWAWPDALNMYARDDPSTRESTYFFFGLTAFTVLCFVAMTLRYWRRYISLSVPHP